VHGVAEFGVEGVEEAGGEESGGRGVDAGFALEEREMLGGRAGRRDKKKAHFVPDRQRILRPRHRGRSWRRGIWAESLVLLTWLRMYVWVREGK